MTLRDREALNDIIAVIDRALGFPIHDFDALEQTDYLQDALIRCLEVLGEAGLPARSPAKRSWWPPSLPFWKQAQRPGDGNGMVSLAATT